MNASSASRVRVAPGETALTRMPRGLNSLAMTLKRGTLTTVPFALSPALTVAG